MDLGLTGRACVVTGASSGIGRATAERLVGEGADVLCVARSAERLDAVVGDLRAAGPGRAVACAADITDPAAGDAVVGACVEAYGRIDVLVNNAGTSYPKALEDLVDADWETQYALHVVGPHRLMRAAAPRMADAGWGRIVNVASSAGKRPSLTNVAYAVTKAGQLSLSRAYADAYAGRGVLVNAIAPGAASSELWVGEGGLADQVAAAKGISRDQALEAQRSKIPLGRFAEPGEIADVIVFLCSERASTVTGAAWSADGGSVAIIV
jgi:3-oxoacyl-[acyl-carrier protein] reductase